MTVAIDGGWIAANPPPVHGSGTTKNSRGHVIVFGGSTTVPGAPRLTAEAAFRAGAGKVQVATIAAAAIPLGVLLPEAGMLPLDADDDGEILMPGSGGATDALRKCDAAVVGPGMISRKAARAVTSRVVEAATDCALILDAAAIEAVDQVCRHAYAICITPNHDELAQLLGWPVDRIAADPETAIIETVGRSGATVVLKGDDTLVAGPNTDILHYPGGGVGMATGGSGDVLAGAIAGLLARGMSPLSAAGWGVWLHGQAGRRLATEPGPIGFLARELAAEFPRLLPQ